MNRNFDSGEKREGQRWERTPWRSHHKIPGAPGSFLKQICTAEVLSIRGMVGDDGGLWWHAWTCAVSCKWQGSPGYDAGEWTEPGCKETRERGASYSETTLLQDNLGSKMECMADRDGDIPWGFINGLSYCLVDRRCLEKKGLFQVAHIYESFTSVSQRWAGTTAIETFYGTRVKVSFFTAMLLPAPCFLGNGIPGDRYFYTQYTVSG